MRCWRWAFFGSLAVGVGAVTACLGDEARLVERPDASAPAAIGDSGSTLAPDAAPSLGCPLGCLPPAPSGWMGPSAVYEGPEPTKPLPCPPDYPQREVDAYHADVFVPPAECACSDVTVDGSSCAIEAVAWPYPTADCAGAGQEINGTAVPNGLTCLERGSSLHSFKVTGRTFVPGECTYGPPTVTKENPVFEITTVACGLAQIASCNERPDCAASPTPAAGFTRLCIHRRGEELCPSLDYAARFVAYEGVDDDRGCSPCEGRATGSCGTTYMARTSCTNPQGRPIAVGECLHLGDASVADLRGLGPTGEACEQTGGGPIGTVRVKDPVTFCCNK